MSKHRVGRVTFLRLEIDVRVGVLNCSREKCSIGRAVSRQSIKNLATRPFEIKSLAGTAIASKSEAESMLSSESGSAVTCSAGGATAPEASARRARLDSGIQGRKPRASDP